MLPGTRCLDPLLALRFRWLAADRPGVTALDKVISVGRGFHVGVQVLEYLVPYHKKSPLVAKHFW